MLSETIVDFGMRRAEYKKVKSETRKVEGELPSHKATAGGQTKDNLVNLRRSASKL